MAKEKYWSCAQTLAWIYARQNPSEWLLKNDDNTALVQELITADRCPVTPVALDELLSKLRDGKLSCIADNSGTIEHVPQGTWQFMKICPGLDGFYARNEDYTSPNDTRLAKLRFKKSQVTKLWPSNEHERRGRGRMPKYDWPTFHSNVIGLLKEYGDIDPTVDPTWNQAALEGRMTEWCYKYWTQTPVESVIRAHVKEAIKEFRSSYEGR